MNILNQSAGDHKHLSTRPKTNYCNMSSLMKPRQLNDLTLPRHIISDLKAKIVSNSIESMLFYGEPGTGKSSAANLIMSELPEWSRRKFEGGYGLGPVTLQEKIERYAKGSLFSGAHRLCFIDNVDHMSEKTRHQLIRLIEGTRGTCRFILAANSKARELISSGLRPIWFNVGEQRAIHVKVQIARQYESRLAETGIHFDRQTLIEIISANFPNLQTIADEVQNEFVGIKRTHASSFGMLLRE
jgi:DNA polymerase III delta prime subunit